MPVGVAMRRSCVWSTAYVVTVGGRLVAELLGGVAEWGDVVATWRSKRATDPIGMTFPPIRELSEGGRLPGKTVDVATPTLLERGEGVQE
jgi:hypothetical protein